MPMPQFENPMMYNDGNGTFQPQLMSYYYMRKALIDVAKEMYFSQLSDTMSMPKM